MQSKTQNFFTTVTPFSKTIALILFIAFPFIGFYLGINYEKSKKPPIEFVTKEKVVQVKRDENNRDLIKRCGSETISRLDIYRDHYTQVDGPFWAPDCRHVAWSSWQSGTMGMYKEGIQKHEGLFVYSEKTEKTERVVIPKLDQQIVIRKWDDNESIIYQIENDTRIYTLKIN